MAGQHGPMSLGKHENGVKKAGAKIGSEANNSNNILSLRAMLRSIECY